MRIIMLALCATLSLASQATKANTIKIQQAIAQLEQKYQKTPT